MNLYEIASEYRADLGRLADLDLDSQTVADTLEGMQGALIDKLRAVIAYAMECKAEALATTDAAGRVADLAKRRHARADALTQYALDTMVSTGISQVSSAEFIARPAKTPPAVFVSDSSALPTWAWRTPDPPPQQVDKTAIREALKAGLIVPGAELVSGYRLAVR